MLHYPGFKFKLIISQDKREIISSALSDPIGDQSPEFVPWLDQVKFPDILLDHSNVGRHPHDIIYRKINSEIMTDDLVCINMIHPFYGRNDGSIPCIS
jgi:hypothetical protein